MSLGALRVSLGLDAADFISGLTKSEQQAKRFANMLDRNIAAGIVKAQVAITALSTGARVAAQAFDVLTKGAADFKDLEEETGATAESLASLAVAAGTAGVGMDSVGAAINKLTKNLVGVDDESKAAGAALKALGLNVQEFKQLDPAAQYEAVGKALAGFEDGASKTAVATTLLGKAGAEQLKVFKALEEAGGRQAILTRDQIAQADAYADAQGKAATTLRLYAQAAATEAIPVLTDLTLAVSNLIKDLIGVDEATGQLAANNGAKRFAEEAADAFAVAVNTVQVFSRAFEAGGKLIGATMAYLKSDSMKEGNTVIRSLLADLDELDNRLFFSDRLAAQRAKSKAAAVAPPSFSDARFEASRKKPLNFSGVDADAGARQRKALDAQISSIRDWAEQQRDAFEFANRYAKSAYDDGLLSLTDFFAEEERIRDSALQVQLQALDQERAALEAALPRTKATERIDLENRIAEVAARRGNAVLKASRDGVLAAQDERRSLAQLQQQYQDFRAAVLQLGGDNAGAARLRIDQQVADARKLLAATGGNQGEADRYRTLLTQTEALNEAQRQYGILVDRSRTAEESLLLVAQESGSSELETLRAVGAARQKTLASMSAMVDKANELALALGTPEAIQFAERLGLAFKQAAAEADPLLTKIRDVGEQAGRSIADNFADAIVEGKGLRDVLTGIEKDLVRIVTQNLVTKPLGDWLSGLLGGNGQASGGGGWIGAIGSWAGSLFGGGKAIGGPTMPNTLYQVGERRPEVYDDGSRQWLLTGSRRGRIDPNPSFAGRAGMTVQQTFVLQQPADRRTQSQVGASAARGLAMANQRNN